MEQSTFYIVIDCIGHRRKGMKINNATYVNLQHIFGLNEQKCIFVLMSLNLFYLPFQCCLL